MSDTSYPFRSEPLLPALFPPPAKRKLQRSKIVVVASAFLFFLLKRMFLKLKKGACPSNLLTAWLMLW